MATLAEKVALAEKHLRTKDDQAFTLEGREWVRDQYWAAIDGYKWWPNDAGALCDECRVLAGTVHPDWIHEEDRELVPGHVRVCQGLDLQPLRFTVMNLPRREGKTFNAAAYSIVTMAQRMNTYMLYAAASEDQSDQLIQENWVLPLERSSGALRKRFNQKGSVIECPRTRSQLEVVSSSFRSAAGRGKTHVIIDEARDVPARTATTLFPSLWDNFGWECPHGHLRYKGQRATTKCNVCNERLVPWYARAIIMSSSGMLDGTDRDWFAELVEQLEQEPDPNYHLFRLEESQNPAVDLQAKDAFVRVFGRMESTKAFVEVEAGNQFVRPGDEFVPEASIRACTEPRTENLGGGDEICVAFLDTAITRDLVSLVLLAEDSERMGEKDTPWTYLRAGHVAYWDPKEFKGGQIDDRVIEAHLAEVLPRWPGLLALDVDVRGSRVIWAETLVSRARIDYRQTWGRLVHRYIHGKREQLVRDTAWAVFQEYILAERIRWPKIPALQREIRGVKIVRRASGDYEVRDRNRKVRHADIAEGFAGACYRIHQERSKRKVEVHVHRSERLERMFKPATAGIRPRGGADPAGSF